MDKRLWYLLGLFFCFGNLCTPRWIALPTWGSVLHVPAFFFLTGLFAQTDQSLRRDNEPKHSIVQYIVERPHTVCRQRRQKTTIQCTSPQTGQASHWGRPVHSERPHKRPNRVLGGLEQSQQAFSWDLVMRSHETWSHRVSWEFSSHKGHSQENLNLSKTH